MSKCQALINMLQTMHHIIIIIIIEYVLGMENAGFNVAIILDILKLVFCKTVMHIYLHNTAVYSSVLCALRKMCEN